MLTSRSIPADISVFLRIRCSISPDLEGRSFLCDACDHVFFTPLLTNDQMASLYAGYRGALYNQMRLAVEPGYAPFIPAFADPDSAHDQARRAMYDQTFPADLKSRTHVIDFGGGDGRFSRYIFPNSKLIVVEEDFERNGGDLVGALSSSDMFFLRARRGTPAAPLRYVQTPDRWTRRWSGGLARGSTGVPRHKRRYI